MKLSFISSLAIQNAMRYTINRTQQDVQNLQTEIVTGRHADIGISLGAEAARSVTLNRDILRLETIRDSNVLVTQRLSASQAALESMADSAQSVLEAFISVSSADDSTRLTVARRTIESAFDAFTGAANTSANGEYLFSGVHTDVKPLENWFEAGSSPKAAFDALFLGHFGFDQTNPATASITVTQMDDFMSNVLEPAFFGAAWNTDWSSASDTNMSSRITRTEIVESSSNANSNGMRSMALAAVIGMELLDLNISSEVRNTVNSRAILHAGQAVTGVDQERGKLGIAENRVGKANIALEAQIRIVRLHIGELEGVDAYEASTRMNTLLTQVETSYALTARIQQLNLMNYL